MTDLRTAAQQALEALELAQTDVHWELNSPTRKFLRKAEENLRAALAESERDWSMLEAAQEALREHMAEIHRLRAALAQQDEQVEPVAWMYTGIKQDGTEHGPHLVWKPKYMDAMSASKGAKATPLYAAPPQRKPLVDPAEYDDAGAAERYNRELK